MDRVEESLGILGNIPYPLRGYDIGCLKWIGVKDMLERVILQSRCNTVVTSLDTGIGILAAIAVSNLQDLGRKDISLSLVRASSVDLSPVHGKRSLIELHNRASSITEVNVKRIESIEYCICRMSDQVFIVNNLGESCGKRDMLPLDGKSSVTEVFV